MNLMIKLKERVDSPGGKWKTIDTNFESLEQACGLALYKASLTTTYIYGIFVSSPEATSQLMREFLLVTYHFDAEKMAIFPTILTDIGLPEGS